VAKWKIAILDAEQESRDLLLDLFRGTPFEAVTATTRASQTLASADLILLNLRTPDMDFHTEFRELQDRAKDTPILVLASYHPVERSARELSRPTDFVTYPTDPSEKVGESVEYSVFIEGDGNDRARYPIRIQARRLSRR
jgi:CheY-like chemotaxis protein